MNQSHYVTAAQVRKLDELAVSRHGMNSLQLMENAGAGASLWIKEARPRERVLILCGVGNNGGDGFVVARHLHYYGFDVTLALLGEPSALSGDALVNYKIIESTSIHTIVDPAGHSIEKRIRDLTSQDIVIDALLGTGAKLPLRPHFAALTAAANLSSAYRIALDIPTGFDCDSGNTDPNCFRANDTLTFAARKIGFNHPNAATYTGDIHLIPVGVPRELLHFVFEGPTSNADQ